MSAAAKPSTPESTQPPKPVRAKAASNGAVEPSPDLWDVLRSLKAGEFNAYVYRLWPKIDRRDEAHYLTKTGQHFDEDWLLRTFGSGKYSLRLNDAKQRTIASKTVSLHNPNHPPKVDPAQITTDPENETYWRVWGAEPAAAPAAVGATPQGGDSAAAIKALEKVMERMQSDSSAIRSSERELLTDAARQAVAMVKEQNGQGGSEPARIIETFVGLLTATLSRPAAGGSELAPIVSMMQAQIESQNRLMLELLKDRRDREPAAGGSGVGQLGEMLAVIRELRNEFSDTPPPQPEQPWWQSFAPALAPALQIVASQIGGSGIPPGLPALAGPPPMQPPHQSNMPREAHNTPPVDQSRSGAHQPPLDQQGPQSGPEDPLFQRIFTTIAHPLALHLADAEVKGYDFAAWVINGYGAQVLSMAQNFDAAKIETTITASPMWAALQAEGVSLERLRSFVEEFRSWTGDDPDEAQPERQDAKM